ETRTAALTLATAPVTDTSPLLGQSPAIVAIRHTIAQVADTDLTILLQGESGTGKEVVARLLAARSGRSSATFVKINCAAIPYELWESELFGYEPGAFTGAIRHKSGKFELAGGGTMFLDEIGEMPLPHQAKLLHVLQDGEFNRLGGGRSLFVDVRVIAASNRDLRAAVEEGGFRRDLYYRLNVVAIALSPLRERPGDIPLLADHFLNRYTSLYRRAVPELSPAVRRHMLEYQWPGNVRELENLLKRYVVLGNENALLGELLVCRQSGAQPSSAEPVVPEAGSLLDIGRRAARQAEREALLRTLERTRWNRRLAAQQLGISYKSLQNKLKTALDAPA
ncbi:MAG: sigma-54 interaction domain-containing protein, partial [Terriglobales bacterium]